MNPQSRPSRIERNRRGQYRCSWGESPCPKVGHGNPPLCRKHYALVIVGDAAADPIDRVFDRVDDVVARGAEKVVIGLTVGLSGFIERLSRPKAPSDRVPKSSAREFRRPGAPPPPRRPEPTAPAEDPRDVLGFEPSVVLTREMIKERQRAMAALVHPDHGGSTRAMQRINTAATALLAQISS